MPLSSPIAQTSACLDQALPEPLKPLAHPKREHPRHKNPETLADVKAMKWFLRKSLLRNHKPMDFLKLSSVGIVFDYFDPDVSRVGYLTPMKILGPALTPSPTYLGVDTPNALLGRERLLRGLYEQERRDFELDVPQVVEILNNL